mgnify:FL=1
MEKQLEYSIRFFHVQLFEIDFRLFRVRSLAQQHSNRVHLLCRIHSNVYDQQDRCIVDRDK